MRYADVILLLAMLAGIVSLISERMRLAPLEARLAHVNRTLGDMVVGDKSLMHVQAMSGEAPFQWAWRIYLPDNCSGTIFHYSGGGSGSHGFFMGNRMIIARCSIGKTRSGNVGVYFRFAGGSSFSSFGTPEFLQFLTDNFHRLNVEQLGADKPMTIKSGTTQAVLLKLSMPDDLAKEATARFEDPNVRRLIPTLMEVKLDLK